MSRPCDRCVEYMKLIRDKIKINKVYYFDWKGKFVFENLDDMKPGHISNGWRHYESS